LGISAFEKMKCIFSIAPVESLEKSQECFSLKKHLLDAGHGGIKRWPSVGCIVAKQRVVELCVGASDG